MKLTEDLFSRRVDMNAIDQRVEEVVHRACTGTRDDLVRFLGHYIGWNATFGAGVATLAGAIGRATSLFRDEQELISSCADRASRVGSYFFDAARDEFDDSATPHRDTHRTLGQAVLKGMADHYDLSPAEMNTLLEAPEWLVQLCERTGRGYGANAPHTREALFHSIGYHLGSELLADAEFTILDRTLRALKPQVVRHLLSTRVELAGARHPAYYWIGIHSGHGGGVEMDHFSAATAGAEEAFRYTPRDQHAPLLEELLAGFDEFAACHHDFFSRAAP